MHIKYKSGLLWYALLPSSSIKSGRGAKLSLGSFVTTLGTGSGFVGLGVGFGVARDFGAGGGLGNGDGCSFVLAGSILYVGF